MSWLTGHSASRSKAPSTHGTIHTENPELLKLLQEVSPDNQNNKCPSPRKFPADTERKDTNTHVLDLHRGSPDTEHSKNIKNLLNNQKRVITKSDLLKGNIFVSDSGDAKGSSYYREGQDKYYLSDNCNDVKEIDNVNISDFSKDGNTGFVNADSKEHVNEFYKEYHQKKVRISAEACGTSSLIKKKNFIVEDPSLLSDITESDCETVGSTSSELARLKTPSRSSLNEDFEDSSLVSSPVHLQQSQGDTGNRNRKSERDSDRARRSSSSLSGKDSITLAGNRGRAGATPYQSNQRVDSIAPSVDILKEGQNNSGCSNTPEVITSAASPAQSLLKVNSPNYGPQGNLTHRSTNGTEVFRETGLGSTNKYRTDELANCSHRATSEVTASVSSLAVRVPASQVISSRDHNSRSGKLHPAYSELSPRISPTSSQSEAINSRLQKLTRDTSLHPHDTVTPRANISYLSQRLKSRGETGKRSTSVSAVKDSLDSQILDIEKDSLDIQTDNKKDNSSNYNQGEVKEQNNQDSKSSLKDNLTEHSSEIKLGDNTRDSTKQIDNRKQENNIVDHKRTPISTVDLQKRKTLLEKGKNKQTVNHGIQYTESVNKREDEFLSPLSSSQVTEHREFVLRTNPSKLAARNHPGEGSSQPLHYTADSGQTAGSVSSSKRTTPSVKKVYIESPVFTQEEEEVYRFVSSRLEDSKEEVVDTYRELDMAALDNQEKYAARFGGQKRVRYTDVDERYEDTDDQGLHAEVNGQFPFANADLHNVKHPQQAARREHNTNFGKENADKENNFDRFETDPRSRSDQQQAYKHHPASPQNPSQAGVFGQGNLGHSSSHLQNQIISNHQDFPVNSNQRRNENQFHGYSQIQGLGNDPETQPNMGLLHPQGRIIQHGVFANQQGLHQQGIRDARFQQPQPLQQHPPNRMSQQPSNQDHQHQNNQQPSNQDQQHRNNQPQPRENNTQPVRGLSLPTGPTYDPVDEEDLKRETTYQQGLRLRIEDRNKRTQQTTIPDGYRNEFDSQDYLQDSLNDEPSDELAESFSGGFVNDSLNMYTLRRQQQHQQQQQQQYPQQRVNPFRNPPPPLPQNFVSISASNSNFPEYRSSRLDNVNFDSEDYADHLDIRQQRVNPQIRPRFYNPQLHPQQGLVNNEEYFEEEPSSDLTVANTGYDVSQRYEDRDEDDVEQPMEAVQPAPPKYDYVSHNREDLGKPAPKSYIKIHEITKEEKERLHEVFIEPKRKPKGGVVKKQGQGQQRVPVSNRQGESEEYMTAAEQVWAQRSSTLAKKVDGSGNRGRRKVPGGLQKYNSDSSLSQTSIPHRRQSFQTTPQQQQQQQLRRTQQQKPPPPDNRAFITEMPTPLSDSSVRGQPVQLHNTTPQHQTEMVVQPITQHLLTQDGQRISVDVNLKLISPPSFGEGPHHYQYQQQPQPYPPPQYPQPQYYGGHGRQYPSAVASYDESGGEPPGNGMPALEYPLQEFYDSDSNDYRHGSPRERYSADEALRLLSECRTGLNPYGKIPPIGKSQAGDHPSSAPAPNQTGSYMDMYMKQKVKDTDRPWYKVYGLNDYRRMQKEIRLGTLGPDLDNDAVKERREKMLRQQDYAKTVMEKNRSQLAHKKPPAFPRPREDNDIIRRRKLAIEYAKSVPKPTVKVQPNEFNNYELASEKSPIAKHHRRDVASDGQNHASPRQPLKQAREMDILDLDKLRQRYEEDKMNEAIIRRNTHSFNKEGYY